MELENDPLANFLDKVEVLRLKYSVISSDDAFNIFSILRKESDEVNLHSNFIATLLSAKGSHGKGQAFLKNFIARISDAHASEIIIYEELGGCLAVRKEYRNIDLYLEFEHALFIVENKIYAEDQPLQLERYHDSVSGKSKKIYLVYLSLNGKDPSKDSLGRLSVDDVITISYSSEIIEWIGLCIKEAATHSTLRETLVQYSNLIKKLTGQSMNAKSMNEVIELLSNHGNAKNALEIWKCRDRARLLAQLYFWEELERQIVNHDSFPAEKMNVVNFGFHKKFLKSYISARRNRKVNYGLFFKVKDIDSEFDICLYIEIGRYNSIYYGLGVVKDGVERSHAGEGGFPEAINSMIVHTPPSSGWWLTATQPIQLGFLNFDDENTVSMLNVEFRQKFVNKLVAEISTFVEESIVSEISSATPPCIS